MKRPFVLLILALAGCGAPQIGEAPEAFRAVDALYTAVSLRDPKLLDQCDATLRGLAESGKLAPDARKPLDALIARARDGQWEAAQSRLGDFIRAQRR